MVACSSGERDVRHCVCPALVYAPVVLTHTFYISRGDSAEKDPDSDIVYTTKYYHVGRS